ncbi:unnamed protein product [Parnassius mnemosyne]|uniref:Uncharacterized protein n=1 Tax=Parnassius mnemosyne TaxID=213953 RepID=A0AAV1LJT4_9NEOP
MFYRSEPPSKLETENDLLQELRKSVRISDKSSKTAPSKLKTTIIEVKEKDSKTKQDCACSSSAHDTEGAQSVKPSKHTSIDKYLWSKKHRKSEQPSDQKSSKQRLSSLEEKRESLEKQRLSSLEEKRESLEKQRLSSLEEKRESLEKQRLSSLEEKRESLEKNKSDRRSSEKKRPSKSNEDRLSQLRSSLSDTQSSKQRLRSSSNESRPSRMSRRSSRDERPSNARHKSAPGEYRPSEDTQREVRPSKKTIPEEMVELKQPDSVTSEQESEQAPQDAGRQDAAVEIRCPICTCATQCHSTSCYQHTSILSKNLQENIYEDIPTPDYTFDDDETLFSDFTSDEKSDTTVQSARCNHVAVEFCDKLTKTKRICKTCCGVKEPPLKRNHQATVTDKTKFKDVSTVTKDWWSPICEKKNKKPCCNKKRDKKSSDKCICTDGRLVTFRSRTQLIPTCCRDVLSPSRYLLESQRQYNEIFTSKFFGNTVYPALHHHKQGGFCASKIKRNSQRGHKTKRLEDFSPRQQLPASPRTNEDHARSDDTTRPALRYLKGLRRYKNRTDGKPSLTRKSRCHKPVYENGGYKILRKSQRNLCLRYVPAEDKITLSGNCNSASGF